MRREGHARDDRFGAASQRYRTLLKVRQGHGRSGERGIYVMHFWTVDLGIVLEVADGGRSLFG